MCSPFDSKASYPFLLSWMRTEMGTERDSKHRPKERERGSHTWPLFKPTAIPERSFAIVTVGDLSGRLATGEFAGGCRRRRRRVVDCRWSSDRSVRCAAEFKAFRGKTFGWSVRCGSGGW
jgi:hypothetical protein